MNSLESLSFLVETARNGIPFSVEQIMSGSVVVWNIPTGAVDYIKKLINDELRYANIMALKTLASKNMESEADVYTLESQMAMTGQLANLRFVLSYTGPRLNPKISTIKSSKPETDAWLLTLVKNAVRKAQLAQDLLNKPRRDQIVDISHVTRYCKMVARYQDYSMAIQIIPNKPNYGVIIFDAIPAKLNGIVVNKQIRRDRKTIMVTLNAAGLPYLERLGKIIDDFAGPLIQQATAPLRLK